MYALTPAHEYLAQFGFRAVEAERFPRVAVGELERQNYAQASLAKFDQIGQPAFQMDEVTIYAIPEEQSQ